jgi:hypothetical protein
MYDAEDATAAEVASRTLSKYAEQQAVGDHAITELVTALAITYSTLEETAKWVAITREFNARCAERKSKQWLQQTVRRADAAEAMKRQRSKEPPAAALTPRLDAEVVPSLMTPTAVEAGPLRGTSGAEKTGNQAGGYQASATSIEGEASRQAPGVSTLEDSGVCNEDLNKSMKGVRKNLNVRKKRGMSTAEMRSANRRLERIFEQWDENNDGCIKVDELTHVLKMLNPKFKDTELKALFSAADENHNGEIDFCEFCDWLFCE